MVLVSLRCEICQKGLWKTGLSSDIAQGWRSALSLSDTTGASVVLRDGDSGGQGLHGFWWVYRDPCSSVAVVLSTIPQNLSPFFVSLNAVTFCQWKFSWFSAEWCFAIARLLPIHGDSSETNNLPKTGAIACYYKVIRNQDKSSRIFW